MENIISRRCTMTAEQIIFFNELANVQDYCVNVLLCKKDEYKNVEELLIDATSEVIYRIMEVLDGYGDNLARCTIVNTASGEVINEKIQLHDKCVEYLKSI